MIEAYEVAMERYFRFRKILGGTTAASKEEFYGFDAYDVAMVHGHKQGSGAGLFFRLHDGRVFDVIAQAHDPDPMLYDKTTH